MPTKPHKAPNALSHGIYSTLTVLPGENRTAFDKLHSQLIAEYAPDGPTEDDIIATMAHLHWRKQNLRTLRIVMSAQKSWAMAMGEVIKNKHSRRLAAFIAPDQEALETIAKVEDRMREDFGEFACLAGGGTGVNFDGLAHDLDIEERFAVMIERCLKRLLFVRGLKSLSGAAASARRVAGPSNAA